MGVGSVTLTLTPPPPSKSELSPYCDPLPGNRPPSWSLAGVLLLGGAGTKGFVLSEFSQGERRFGRPPPAPTPLPAGRRAALGVVDVRELAAKECKEKLLLVSRLTWTALQRTLCPIFLIENKIPAINLEMAHQSCNCNKFSTQMVDCLRPSKNTRKAKRESLYTAHKHKCRLHIDINSDLQSIREEDINFVITYHLSSFSHLSPSSGSAHKNLSKYLRWRYALSSQASAGRPDFKHFLK